MSRASSARLCRAARAVLSPALRMGLWRFVARSRRDIHPEPGATRWRPRVPLTRAATTPAGNLGYTLTMRVSETLDDDNAGAGDGEEGEPRPGLVLIFSGEQPRF